MNFRKQFVRTLTVILGIDEQDEHADRLEALEAGLMETMAEIESIKEVVAALVMSNPNMRIVGSADVTDETVISGSDEGPDGKLLN